MSLAEAPLFGNAGFVAAAIAEGAFVRSGRGVALTGLSCEVAPATTGVANALGCGGADLEERVAAYRASAIPIAKIAPTPTPIIERGDDRALVAVLPLEAAQDRHTPLISISTIRNERPQVGHCNRSASAPAESPPATADASKVMRREFSMSGSAGTAGAPDALERCCTAEFPAAGVPFCGTVTTAPHSRHLPRLPPAVSGTLNLV